MMYNNLRARIDAVECYSPAKVIFEILVLFTMGLDSSFLPVVLTVSQKGNRASARDTRPPRVLPACQFSYLSYIAIVHTIIDILFPFLFALVVIPSITHHCFLGCSYAHLNRS